MVRKLPTYKEFWRFSLSNFLKSDIRNTKCSKNQGQSHIGRENEKNFIIDGYYMFVCHSFWV